MGVNSLPKTVTGQRRGCDLNPGPTAPESSMLTTRLPSHHKTVRARKSWLSLFVVSNVHWRFTGTRVLFASPVCAVLTRGRDVIHKTGRNVATAHRVRNKMSSLIETRFKIERRRRTTYGHFSDVLTTGF